MRVTAVVASILGAIGLGSSGLAQPLDTSFTYQGSLTSAGLPATGLYDLRFRLYSAASGGAQVGATLCADNVAMVDGRFVVRLISARSSRGSSGSLKWMCGRIRGWGAGTGRALRRSRTGRS